MTTDMDIALNAELDSIIDIAAGLGLKSQDIIPFGWTKAKVPIDVLDKAAEATTDGHLILVTVRVRPRRASDWPTVSTNSPGRSPKSAKLSSRCVNRAWGRSSA